jgi:hypothetical protein
MSHRQILHSIAIEVADSDQATSSGAQALCKLEAAVADANENRYILGSPGKSKILDPVPVKLTDRHVLRARWEATQGLKGPVPIAKNYVGRKGGWLSGPTTNDQVLSPVPVEVTDGDGLPLLSGRGSRNGYRVLKCAVAGANQDGRGKNTVHDQIRNPVTVEVTHCNSNGREIKEILCRLKGRVSISQKQGPAGRNQILDPITIEIPGGYRTASIESRKIPPRDERYRLRGHAIRKCEDEQNGRCGSNE